MVVSPPPDTNSFSWLFDIFAWDKLSYALTVVFLMFSGAFVPVFQHWKKKKCEKIKQLDAAETQKIKLIAEETMKPLFTKMNEFENNQAALKDTQKESEHTNKQILGTLRDITGQLHHYQEQQEKNTAKLYYIEGYVKNQNNNTRLKGYGRYNYYGNDSDSNEEDGINNNGGN